MLLATGSGRDSSAAIADLRPLVGRFSIVEVPAQGALAPLAEPDTIAAAIARELSPPETESLPGVIN
jgi:hypothetical protein